MRPLAYTALVLLLANCALSQPGPGEQLPKFEVASIKQIPNWPPPPSPSGQRGQGGGCPTSMKVDRARLDFQCVTLTMLIGYAFQIAPGRVTGPDWMMGPGSPRFQITAAIPSTAATDQVPQMLRQLLADRFRLSVHHAIATSPIFALVVARGGTKLSPAQLQPLDQPASSSSEASARSDQIYGATHHLATGDGATILSSPSMGTVFETGNDPFQGQRWEAASSTMAGLADLLDNVAPLPLPIIDQTGLGGRYQLSLEVTFRHLAPDASAADLFEANQEMVLMAFNAGLRKLGLELNRGKAPLETIAVDHIEKTPSQN
ncbi:MAG TPA: TIGR03435 family protein [Bryobacteraceae bacterium]|nr:TIGR03435 family protein [Bryobacteraceae bacterium]